MAESDGIAVARLLSQEYGITCPPEALILVAHGRSQVYRVEVTRGPIAVKCAAIGSEATPLIAREASTLALLCEQGGSVAQIVPTIAGRTYAEDGQLTALVTEFVEGKPASETPAGFAAVGTALATLHDVMDRHPKLGRGLPRLDPLKTLSDSSAAVAQRIDPIAAQALRARVDALSQRIRQAGALGPADAVGHGDAHGYNLLMTPNRGDVWVDLEDAYTGPRVYDLATVVWSSLRHRETRPLWSAALAAYAGLRPRAVDFEHIATFVALRHLWWLALHARHWGTYRMHQNPQEFFRTGLELFDLICRDACAMPCEASSTTSHGRR